MLEAAHSSAAQGSPAQVWGELRSCSGGDRPRHTEGSGTGAACCASCPGTWAMCCCRLDGPTSFSRGQRFCLETEGGLGVNNVVDAQEIQPGEDVTHRNNCCPSE